MCKETILEIGAGKISCEKLSVNLEDDFCVFLDRGYPNDLIDIHNVINDMISFNKGIKPNCDKYLISADIFDFMDSFPLKFDRIVANRIFEHMEYMGDKSVGRLMEACNKLLVPKGILEIIVPNAALIAKMILDLEKIYSATDIERRTINEVLIINTENNNIACDPHLSTWSPALAEYYIKQEDTFYIIDIKPKIGYEGRNIYMKITCQKKNQ